MPNSVLLFTQDKEYTIRDRDLLPDIRFSGTQNQPSNGLIRVLGTRSVTNTQCSMYLSFIQFTISLGQLIYYSVGSNITFFYYTCSTIV